MSTNPGNEGIEMPPLPSSVNLNAPSSIAARKSTVLDILKFVLQTIIEHPVFVATMSVLTIWTLFSGDILLAACKKNADEGFVTITSIAFFLFLFEIIGVSVYKSDYLHIPDFHRKLNETDYEYFMRCMEIGSFYFWLDIIATASLLFEVSHTLLYFVNAIHSLLIFNFNIRWIG